MMGEFGNDTYVDHIQQNAERDTPGTIPQGIESEPEDWSYSISGEEESGVLQPNAATDTSEVLNRYPARNRRAPQRLIEQTDI